MKKFKSHKISNIVIASSLSALVLLSSGVLMGTNFNKYLNNHYDILNEYAKANMEGVELSSNDLVASLADIKGVSEDLAKEEDSFIRFEAKKGTPIDVIVDEKSQWCMTDNVKQAIKNTVEQYNELFLYINPEYQFRYISKNEYDQNVSNNPFILVTTNLCVKVGAGNARAITSPPEAKQSQYGNGIVSNDAVVIVSSTGTIDLSVEQIQNIISHEFAHALGFVKHSDDLTSMMNSVGSGLCIQSEDFSEDVLNAMLALYYNPATNPHSYDEILNYFNIIIQNRENKLVDYILKLNPNANLEGLSDKEILEQYINYSENNINAYYENLKNYTQSKGLKVCNPNNLINTTYSTTSIYGQTREITLNSNNTYTLKVYAGSRYIMCSGTYTIEEGAIVCKGEYFDVVNGEYKAITDTIYLSSLSNGECIYSTKSKNYNIIGSLTNQMENELSR